MQNIKNLSVSKYLASLFKKWVLWIFLTLDILGAFSQFLPDINLRVIPNGWLAAIGLFWAGFQVHSEIEKKLKNELDKINLDATLKLPNLSISLREGQEYSFMLSQKPPSSELFHSLQKIMNDKERVTKQVAPEEKPYFLPEAELYLFVRIENTGCDLDILSISTQLEENAEIPFHINASGVLQNQAEGIAYPISIKSGQVLDYIIISMKVKAISHQTQAQFASRLKGFREKNYTYTAKITLEAADSVGQRYEFDFKEKIYPRPLIELYIEHWRAENKTDLMRLSGVVP